MIDVISRTKGFALVLVSVMIFGWMGVVVRRYDLNPLALLFFWQLVGFPVFFFSALRRKTLAITKRDFLNLAAMTGLVLLADGSFFAAVKLLPVSSAVFIKFLFPLFVVILAAPIVSKKAIQREYILSAFLGICGLAILVLLRDRSVSFDVLGAGLALITALSTSFAFSFVKRLDHLSRGTLFSYRYGMGLLALSPVFVATGQMSTVSEPRTLLLFAAFAFIFGVLASGMHIKSFVYLDEREVATLGYIEPLFATAYAVLALQEAVSASMVIGGALILASGLMIVRGGKRRSDNARF
ncbi:MAG: hypothetical protein A3J67_00230 [Parcubacteria group bacterium RIFCSPHIGHO2_02_FULL_48_10b]|nr:MAG: hypothetical protein A3J67_00230 [Parcubacteria group bacterium RIFCSPHIGHO2_02_FULL_48_10b]